jgi:hypothetical protein
VDHLECRGAAIDDDGIAGIAEINGGAGDCALLIDID